MLVLTSLRAQCAQRQQKEAPTEANARFALKAPSEVKDILRGRRSPERVVKWTRTALGARRPLHSRGCTAQCLFALQFMKFWSSNSTWFTELVLFLQIGQ